VAVLAISHRDAEEQDFQLRQVGVRWVCQDADAPPMTGNRMTILEALASGPRNRKQVAAALQITPDTAGRMLSRMARADQVVRAAHGIYKLP
jgi:DNA-binding MarR family transcriptional regulator